MEVDSGEQSVLMKKGGTMVIMEMTGRNAAGRGLGHRGMGTAEGPRGSAATGTSRAA
jgi:hypothetical protein